MNLSKTLKNCLLLSFISFSPLEAMEQSNQSQEGFFDIDSRAHDDDEMPTVRKPINGVNKKRPRQINREIEKSIPQIFGNSSGLQIKTTLIGKIALNGVSTKLTKQEEIDFKKQIGIDFKSFEVIASSLLRKDKKNFGVDGLIVLLLYAKNSQFPDTTVLENLGLTNADAWLRAFNVHSLIQKKLQEGCVSLKFLDVDLPIPAELVDIKESLIDYLLDTTIKPIEDRKIKLDYRTIIFTCLLRAIGYKGAYLAKGLGLSKSTLCELMMVVDRVLVSSLKRLQEDLVDTTSQIDPLINALDDHKAGIDIELTESFYKELAMIMEPPPEEFSPRLPLPRMPVYPSL